MNELQRHRYWRLALVVLIALDIALLVVGQLIATRGLAIDPEANTAYVLARSWAANLTLTGLGGIGLFGFYRNGGLNAALLVCVSVGGLLFSHLPIVRGFHGHFLHAGVALVGWSLGFWLSRTWFREQRDAGGAEMAYLCSAAALAATAFNAGLAKIVGFGAGATDSWLIRLSLVMDHPVDALGGQEAFWQVVLGSEWLSSAIGVGLFAVELGAPLMLLGGGWARMWAILLLAYNALMGVLFGMYFWESMILLAFVAIWPPTSALVVSPITLPRGRGVMVLLSFLGLLVLTLPLTRSADEAPTGGDAMGVVSTTPGVEVARFGPIRVGDELPGDWGITKILVWQDHVRFVLQDPAQRVLSLDAASSLTLSGATQYEDGRIRLHYRTEIIEPMTFHQAARTLVKTLADTDRDGAMGRFEDWLRGP